MKKYEVQKLNFGGIYTPTHFVIGRYHDINAAMDRCESEHKKSPKQWFRVEIGGIYVGDGTGQMNPAFAHLRKKKDA
jgi:hypothetical protein